MTRYPIGADLESVNNPAQHFIVASIGPVHAGVQYYKLTVVGNGQKVMMAEPDLRLRILGQEPQERLAAGRLGGYPDFQRLITFQRLNREHALQNNIYAFNASRTRFLSYQFKPLLKFLDSPGQRLLIADEVGLGKTIEAGLILTELRARQAVKRVLIICPANLSQKWYMELKRRFGVEFRVLDARELDRFFDSYIEDPEQADLMGILSLETARRQATIDRLRSVHPDFDLVIVDEAHHMRNFGRLQRQVGEALAGTAEALVLLTATPVHLGSRDLFSLLNLLDADEFPHPTVFDERLAQNAPLVEAQILAGRTPPEMGRAHRSICGLSPGHWVAEQPAYSLVLDKMESYGTHAAGDPQQRELLHEIRRHLAELNLFGHLLTRTRKREVKGQFPRRRALALRLTFTPLEMQMYQAVTNYVRSHLGAAESAFAKWILHMPQRRVASCIPAMVEYYRDHFSGKGKTDADAIEIADDEEILDEDEVSVSHVTLKLKDLVATWPENGPDTKYDTLKKALRRIIREGGKTMIFATFRDTLSYLSSRLSQDGIRNAMIHGGVSPQDRVGIIDSFRSDSLCSVLLSSRVGGEGLDFQFCDTLFNYDLPWNPMEVEQRIGRLDRLGQESAVIRIYNFSVDDTIEQRILERLYQRIEIFKFSVGDLELILGEQWKSLRNELLSRTLTGAEEEQMIEEAALAIVNQRGQLEKLEGEAARLMGVDGYLEDEIRKIQDHRRYVTGEQLRQFLLDFLRRRAPNTRLEYNLKSHKGRLYPDQDLAAFIKRSTQSPDLIRFLASFGDGVPITFDSEAAFRMPDHEFLNTLHPLVEAISALYARDPDELSSANEVVVPTDRLTEGLYLFYVFRLGITAAETRNYMEVVVLDENLDLALEGEDAEALLGSAIETGRNPRQMGEFEVESSLADDAYRYAQSLFLDRLNRMKADVERTNEARIKRRLASVEATFGRNMQRLRTQLSRDETGGKDKRYLSMVRGRLARLDLQLTQKLQQLDELRQVDINWSTVAAGIMHVVRR